MSKADIIVAAATAPGRSGIGVVRVSGPDLGPLMDGIVGRRLPARVATLCDFRGADSAPIDQGIALYFPGPQSYTGQDVLELQGHGGPVVMQLLVRRCGELGARLAEPGEFTKRAYLSGKLDLARDGAKHRLRAGQRHAAHQVDSGRHGIRDGGAHIALGELEHPSGAVTGPTTLTS